MKEVTDPGLLDALNAGNEVTDPDILRQLETAPVQKATSAMGPRRQPPIPMPTTGVRPEVSPHPLEPLDDTGRLLATGAMFGWANEISAGLNALLGIGDGETVSERYDNNLAYENMRNAAIREREPGAAFAAELAGGMGTGLPGGAKVMGARVVQEGGKAIKLLTGAGLGATGGAIAGAGYAPPGQRKEGALIGGGLGAVVGGVAIPLARKTVEVTIRKFMASGIGKDMRVAAQQILRALQRDDLTPDEAFRRVSELAPEGRLVDVGPNTQRLGRAVAGQPGRASKVAIEVLEDRQEGQGARLTAAVNRFLDPSGDFAGAADDLAKIRAAGAKPLYDAAYAKTVEPSEKLISLFRRPALEQAWQKAKTIAANEGDILPDNLFVTRPDGGKIVNPDALKDVRLLDYIKRGLDDLVESKRDPVTGKIQGEVQRGIDSLRKQYIAVVDELVPEYKAARAAWAGPSRAMEKMNQGRRFIKADEEITRAQLERMTPDEKFHFRMGAARGLRDTIYSVQDGADAVKRFFGNPLKRARIRAVFDSDEQFDAFRKIMEKETAFYRTRSIVGPFQGSQTQLRQADAADIAGAVSDLAQGNTGTAALRFVRNLFGRGADGLTPKQAETLARTLFTNDPETNRQIVQALSMQRLFNSMGPLYGGASAEAGRQTGAAISR